MIGDKSSLDVLIRALLASKTTLSQGSVALALGHVGDHRAVEPLLGLLEDRDAPALARGFAAVALGRVCDKDDVP